MLDSVMGQLLRFDICTINILSIMSRKIISSSANFLRL
jgi:hypothetical protein